MRANRRILLSVQREREKKRIFSPEENNIYTARLQEIPRWSSSRLAGQIELLGREKLRNRAMDGLNEGWIYGQGNRRTDQIRGEEEKRTGKEKRNLVPGRLAQYCNEEKLYTHTLHEVGTANCGNNTPSLAGTTKCRNRTLCLRHKFSDTEYV